MALVRTDTAVLRAAAARLRNEVVPRLGEAVAGTRSTEERHALARAFDRYGSLPAYRAAALAWRDELGDLATVLDQLASALEAAAERYQRSDADAAGRMGAIR